MEILKEKRREEITYIKAIKQPNLAHSATSASEHIKDVSNHLFMAIICIILSSLTAQAVSRICWLVYVCSGALSCQDRSNKDLC